MKRFHAAGICDCCDDGRCDCGAIGSEDDPCTCDLDMFDCTHCGGSGDCAANADPLWDCDDQFHPCHACGGSGKRRDQRIF